MEERKLRVREVKEDEYEEVADLAMNAYLALPGYCINDGYVSQIRNVAGRNAAPNATVLVVTLTEEDGKEKVIGTATFISGPGPFAEVDEKDAAGMFSEDFRCFKTRIDLTFVLKG